MALRIGPLVVDPPVVLAPMAGVTDAPFRVVCAEQGGGLYVSEMVSARGLVSDNAKSWAMTRHHPCEPSRSVQLYGTEPETIGTAVRALVDRGAVDHVDLNFGCPVAKVMRNGGGAALPVKRRLFARIVGAAVEAAGCVPVTVKMRMGLDDDRLTYQEAGRIAALEGCAGVALHARTAAQGYAGTARWSAIAELKQTVAAVADIPVLGNGDIWAADDAVRMVADTGCDGVVVGRGCLGRPWLFADLARAFAADDRAPAMTAHAAAPPGPPRLGTVLPMIRRHLELALSWEDEPRSAVRRFRKHLRWYLQGYPVGRDAHRRAGTVATAHDVTALLGDLDRDATVVPGAEHAPRGRTGGVGRMVLPEGWCDDPEADVTIAEPVGAVSGG